MADSVAVLEFEEYPGQEIRLRISDVPLTEYWDFAEWRMEWSRAGFDELCERLGKYLVSWTFPEPATVEGLKARDPNLLVAMRNQWAQAVANVPLPLPVASSNGASSKIRRSSTNRRNSTTRS
jgi:hypothetical protein